MADRKISDLTALTTPATGDLIPIVDVSEAAAADKNKSITVGELLRGAPDGTAAAPGIAFESDGGNGIFLAGTDQVGIATAGTERVEFGTSEVVFNDGGNDVDFRIESDTNANLFFVDAGNDRIGVGINSPSKLLHVSQTTADGGVLQLSSNWSSVAPLLTFERSGGAVAGELRYNDGLTAMQLGTTTNHNLHLMTNTSNALTINTSQQIGIGTTAIAAGNSLQIGANSANIAIGGALSANGSGRLKFTTSNSVTNWQISNNDNVAGGFEITPSTAAGGTTFTTPALFINSSGRVGIGTTTPARGPLHVHATSGESHLHLTNADTGSTDGDGFSLVSLTSLDSREVWLIQRENAAMRFYVNSSYKMAIDNSGRLLVGPSSAFDTSALIQTSKTSGSNSVAVNIDSLANTEVSRFRATASVGGNEREVGLGLYKHSGITNCCGYIRMQREDGANSFLWTDNSAQFRISSDAAHIGTTSGTVVGTQTSDKRLKNVGENVSYGLTEILQLQPKQYALKSEPDTNKLGFIAQEVESVIPEAVFDTGEELEGHQEGDRTKLGMEYVQLIPVLVNAIKEQQATIADLQTRLEALEAN